MLFQPIDITPLSKVKNKKIKISKLQSDRTIKPPTIPTKATSPATISTNHITSTAAIISPASRPSPPRMMGKEAASPSWESTMPLGEGTSVFSVVGIIPRFQKSYLQFDIH
jgi:hypothetical protein